jgi:hypothetical protein
LHCLDEGYQQLCVGVALIGEVVGGFYLASQLRMMNQRAQRNQRRRFDSNRFTRGG